MATELTSRATSRKVESKNIQSMQITKFYAQLSMLLADLKFFSAPYRYVAACFIKFSDQECGFGKRSTWFSALGTKTDLNNFTVR